MVIGALTVLNKTPFAQIAEDVFFFEDFDFSRFFATINAIYAN